MSPRYRETWEFRRDWEDLEFDDQEAFWHAIRTFLRGLRQGDRFPERLRIHELHAPHGGIWSLTWGPDGRATFTFDTEARGDDAEVTWRRIGAHDIYESP